MTFAHESDATDRNKGDNCSPTPRPVQSVDEALEQIDRVLHQMLLLAELSAGDGAVDRESLQKVLERLQDKIDRIADTI